MTIRHPPRRAAQWRLLERPSFIWDPYNKDRSATRGRRPIRGERADLRAAPCMATRVAVRCNPALAEDSTRLTKAGRQPKVALVACMRRLLTILNVMARDNEARTPPKASSEEGRNRPSDS